MSLAVKLFIACLSGLLEPLADASGSHCREVDLSEEVPQGHALLQLQQMKRSVSLADPAAGQPIEEVCEEKAFKKVKDKIIGELVEFPKDVRRQALETQAGTRVFPHQTVASPQGGSCSETFTNQNSLKDIRGTLRRMEYGSTVCFEGGLYTDFIKDLPLSPGMHIKCIPSASGEKPVFDASSMSEPMIWETSGPKYSNITISDIHFKNIFLHFKYGKNISLYNLIFSDGTPTRWKSGPCKDYYDKGSTQISECPTTNVLKNDAYINLYSISCNEEITEHCNVVAGCDLRRGPHHPGRGMKLNGDGFLVEDNICGGLDVKESGYFTTCLNLKGTNSMGTRTVANRNTFRRMVAGNIFEQDHGIYAKQADQVTISNNLIAGWMADAAGGNIKLDSSTHAIIRNNLLVNSGILVYDNQRAIKAVTIQSNAIFMNPDNRGSTPEEFIAAGSEYKLHNGIGMALKQKKGDDKAESGFSIAIRANNLYGRNSDIRISFKKRNWQAKLFNKQWGGVYSNTLCSLVVPEGVNMDSNLVDQDCQGELPNLAPTTLRDAKALCVSADKWWFRSLCGGLMKAPQNQAWQFRTHGNLIDEQGKNTYVSCLDK